MRNERNENVAIKVNDIGILKRVFVDKYMRKIEENACRKFGKSI